MFKEFYTSMVSKNGGILSVNYVIKMLHRAVFGFDIDL